MRWIVIGLIVVSAAPVFARQDLLDLAGPLDGGNAKDGVAVSLISDVKTINPKQPFTIGVKLDVKPGFHTFYRSTGGIALAPKIEITGPQGFQIGPLQYPGPDLETMKLPGADGKQIVEVSYVYNEPTIVMATVTPLSSIPAGAAEFSANVSLQYCKNHGSCFPPQPQKLTLKLPIGSRKNPAASSAEEPEFAAARARLPQPGGESGVVRTLANVNATKLEPGDNGELRVAIQVDKGWFLPANRGPLDKVESTEVIVHEIPGVQFERAEFPKPDVKPEFLEPFPGLLGYGNGKTCIVKIPFSVTPSYRGDGVAFSGIVRCQPIGFPDDKLPVRFLSFATYVPGKPAPAVSSGSEIKSTPAGGAPAVPDTGVAATVGSGSPLGISMATDDIKFEIDNGPVASLTSQLWLAFLGGLILNIMPCVLPVVAIKAISFVQQAGQSRRHIFLLNLAYALGVIAVFLALATMAVTASLGWGQLFQKPEFKLVMAAIVFTMGLSLLGVFEIPVPGFIGSGAGHQEGPFGAFMTGILATLLATPCSGPFLGVALTWSLKQTAPVTYLVWATMGLGMAAPYLVLGLFPAAIRWLPKPGAWMVTFKEFAGLTLMATVIYLVMLMDQTNVVPVLVMLVGIAIAVWMIDSLYTYDSPTRRKWSVRVLASAVALGTGYLAFVPIKALSISSEEKRFQKRLAEMSGETGGHDIVVKKRSGVSGDGVVDFEPYSDRRLKELIAKGTTVMIDFTADWCPTCKFLEATVINSREVEAQFEKSKMAALVVDRTEKVPELEAAFKRFGGDAIPYLVILPGKQPQRVLRLSDWYTKDELLEKMREAGPSKGP